MAYDPLDIQRLQSQIENIDRLFAKIQIAISESMKERTSNMNWFGRWTFLWAERTKQIKLLWNLENKYHQLLKMAESLDSASLWRLPSLELLNDAMNYMIPLNMEFLKYFGEDLTEMVTISKPFIAGAPDAQLKYLNDRIEMFLMNPIYSEMIRKISFGLHFIQLHLNFVSTELRAPYDSKSVVFQQSPNGIAERKLIMISEHNPLRGHLKEFLKYQTSFNLGIFSIMFELSLKGSDSKELMMNKLQSRTDVFKNIKLKLIKFRSTDKNKPSWFDKWCRISSDAQIILTTVFELWDLAIDAREHFDGNDFTKMKASTDELNELMFNSKSLFGLFEIMFRKCWGIYGDTTVVTIWSNMKGLSEKSAAELDENVKNLGSTIDSIDQQKYNQLFSNIKDTLNGIRIKLKSFTDKLDNIRTSEGNKLSENAYKSLTEKHFEIIDEYLSVRLFIDQFSKINFEMINRLSNILSPSDAVAGA